MKVFQKNVYDEKEFFIFVNVNIWKLYLFYSIEIWIPLVTVASDFEYVKAVKLNEIAVWCYEVRCYETALMLWINFIGFFLFS